MSFCLFQLLVAPVAYGWWPHRCRFCVLHMAISLSLYLLSVSSVSQPSSYKDTRSWIWGLPE